MMSNWELESNSVTQTMISVLGLVVGGFFIFIGKNFRLYDTNEFLYGFILGIMIFFISLATLFLGSKKFIIVDTN